MVSLPPVLLGFRSAYSEHLKSSVAELLCVEPLQLPGEFLSPNNYIKLSEDLNLNTCSHVYLPEGTTHDALLSPPSEPHLVVGRNDKNHTAWIPSKNISVSID
ncbi:hypothetical protein M513_12398 [Trichuris suis]|uniref:Uncharacterized protein n=1 Tax=Trichuris suis TaxID=68888 RepID=A0A085LP39_9BILA|nr:hypothetical protein M513_12398 [Trichuris suis]